MVGWVIVVGLGPLLADGSVKVMSCGPWIFIDLGCGLFI